MKIYNIILCVMISMGLQIRCMNQLDEVVIPQSYWLIAAEIFGQLHQESQFPVIKNEYVQPYLIVHVENQSKPIKSQRSHLYPIFTVQNYLDIDSNYTTKKEKDAFVRKKQRVSSFLIEEGLDISECSQTIQDEIKVYAAQYAYKREMDKQRLRRQANKCNDNL